MTLNEIEADRVRQSERTVDNLKRLYAVLFALSFSILASGAIAKIRAALASSSWVPDIIGVHLEMTIGFALTAGLFYYQGDRFLDVVLARRPIPNVSALDFGFNYLVNVVTMAPFYLMAYSLGKLSGTGGGFTWYLLAYVVLILNGLFWLIFRSMLRFIFRRPDGQKEIEGLNAFWMIMNSGMLVVVLLLYLGFSHADGPCVAGDLHGIGVWFVAILGVVILTRDWLDFHNGWPVLYPVADPAKDIKRRSMLFALIEHRGWRIAAFAGSLVLVMVSVYLISITKLYDVVELRRLCRP